MDTEERRVRWIVCHGITRPVTGGSVDCPFRGPTDAAVCLDCRFLTTSSRERADGDWCELVARGPIGPAEGEERH